MLGQFPFDIRVAHFACISATSYMGKKDCPRFGMRCALVNSVDVAIAANHIRRRLAPTVWETVILVVILESDARSMAARIIAKSTWAVR